MDVLAFAQSLHTKMDAVGIAVEDLKREQAFQTKAMGIMQTSAEAQTRAISNLQQTELRHAAFFAKLQALHDNAVALNPTQAEEEGEGTEMDVGTVPGKDPMTASRQ